MRPSEDETGQRLVLTALFMVTLVSFIWLYLLRRVCFDLPVDCPLTFHIEYILTVNPHFSETRGRGAHLWRVLTSGHFSLNI